MACISNEYKFNEGFISQDHFLMEICVLGTEKCLLCF